MSIFNRAWAVMNRPLFQGLAKPTSVTFTVEDPVPVKQVRKVGPKRRKPSAWRALRKHRQQITKASRVANRLS